MTDDTAGIDTPGIETAIADILGGLSRSITLETRQSPMYVAMATGDKVQAVTLAWEDTRDRTIATAMVIETITRLRMNDAAMLVLFDILPQMNAFRDLYRFDGLGGSTDRAFRDYHQLLMAALNDGTSPIANIPERLERRAAQIPIYDHLKDRVMSLLRWLDCDHPGITALREVSVDLWGSSKSDRAAYLLTRQLPALVTTTSEYYLEPTVSDLEAVTTAIFGVSPNSPINRTPETADGAAAAAEEGI